jgi:hypothetical protein
VVRADSFLSRVEAATPWYSRIADSSAACFIYSAGNFGHTGILRRQAAEGKLRTKTETKNRRTKDTRAVIDLFVRMASRPQRINSPRRAWLLSSEPWWTYSYQVYLEEGADNVI